MSKTKRFSNDEKRFVVNNFKIMIKFISKSANGY